MSSRLQEHGKILNDSLLQYSYMALEEESSREK